MQCAASNRCKCLKICFLTLLLLNRSRNACREVANVYELLIGLEELLRGSIQVKPSVASGKVFSDAKIEVKTIYIDNDSFIVVMCHLIYLYSCCRIAITALG